jgi:hypothetical protein
LQNVSRRTQLIIWGGIAAVALVAVLLIATAGSGEGGFAFLGTSNEPTVTPGRQIVDADGTEVPVEQQDSVADFTAAYGEPAGTDFARLRIPAIGVDAPVGNWFVDGPVMQEPYGPVDVAFYDLSNFSGLGGYPGAGQNAVFGGHVDLNRDVAYAGDHYRGPAVFWALDQLTPGTIIEVEYNGQLLEYSVMWVEHLEASDATDWRQYWSSDVPVDSITLFTCGGEFDFESLSYSHRTVVRAERI